MIPVLGIPTYNRMDLLIRCLKSIDYPVDTLVIVNNTGNPQIFFKPNWVDRIVEILHPNAGVAASWNEIITLFPAPWWMLVNDDIQFSAGDLQKMCEAANTHQRDVACLYGNHGASFWVVTKRGIEKVGVADQNLFPAYLEDSDWSYRADLLRQQRMNVNGINAIHGVPEQRGSCTINLNPKIAAENCRTHGNNFGYYVRKWGGINGEEKFKTPFNDPNWPIWAWKFEPDFRAKQQWNL